MISNIPIWYASNYMISINYFYLIVSRKEEGRGVATEIEWLENKNGKKNNCMVILSDKQAKFHTRKPGHG